MENTSLTSGAMAFAYENIKNILEK